LFTGTLVFIGTAVGFGAVTFDVVVVTTFLTMVEFVV
jgi:hypothetical protein